MQFTLLVLVFTLGVVYPAAGTTYNFYNADKNNDFVTFSVGRNTNFAASKDTRLSMNVEMYNDEKHFDMKTSIFTAPVKGVYSFSFGAGGIHGKQMHLTLKAGDPEFDRIRIFDFNTNYGYGSATVALKLNKGDAASIWVRKGFTAHGNVNFPPSTYFTGTLVKSLDESCK